jgi:transcriptional regulator with XRE-family HTH domain
MSKQQVPLPNARQRLASNLRSLRAQHKLSQEALADLVGLHRTYVGSVERSERNVSLDNVERLAAALGVDIAELLSENLIDSSSARGR